MSRRSLLQTLSKVRGIAKEVAEAKLRQATLLQREQDRIADHARDRAQHAAHANADPAPMPAAVVQSRAAACLRLESDSQSEEAKASQVAAAGDQALATYAEADRQVEGVDRILAERAATARARDAKAANRRLDDRPRTGPRLKRFGLKRFGLALFVATGVAAVASEARAESVSQNASLEVLLSEIQSRMSALDQRAAELDERERAIGELEQAVDQRIKELDLVSTEIEDRIEGWEEAQGAKTISRLSKIYAAMPPPEAAALVEELDLDLATHVLRRMKPKESAALLPLLSPYRALTITRFVGHPLGIVSAPPNEVSQ